MKKGHGIPTLVFLVGLFLLGSFMSENVPVTKKGFDAGFTVVVFLGLPSAVSFLFMEFVHCGSDYGFPLH